jgi:hypothetical protein
MNSSEVPRLVALWGSPRSGTTWLGQIFDSHPSVAYRFQPLFSYRFKSAINAESPPAAIRQFLAELASTDDDFIRQTKKRQDGLVPVFSKTSPTHLVFKEVRYLHLAAHFLASAPDSHAVGIVRHPCAAINSWLKTPREFQPGWDWRREWRHAHSKNLGRPEEYYGFERWQWVTRQFLALAGEYPERFTLVRYEDLVLDPIPVVARLFSRCGLPLSAQTGEFLRLSQAREVDHPDSVYRRPEVKDRWQVELPPQVKNEILGECRGTVLEQFCS